MRLAEVRAPVDDGEQTEAHGEHHERELVERAVLRAAEHHAAVRRLPQPRQEPARPAPRRHRLQYRRVPLDGLVFHLLLEAVILDTQGGREHPALRRARHRRAQPL